MQPNMPMPPMQPMQPQMLPPMREPRQSHLSLIVAILMSLFFVAALIFGIWAYAGMQENKTNLDAKIEAASAVAVKAAEATKDAEFAEREKDPNRVYTGSSTFGTLSFSFPKTWSVYTEEKDTGTILDYYSSPFLVRGTGKENSFALRAQILDTNYDKELAKFDQAMKKGTVTATAYVLARVPNILGVRLSGEVAADKQGVMVILPLRDKTIKIWTESKDFLGDFDKIIETASFIP